MLVIDASFLFSSLWSSMKKIIFDVGKVLIQWDVRPFFYKIFNDHDKVETFLKDVDFFNWNLELDRGLSFHDGVKT